MQRGGQLLKTQTKTWYGIKNLDSDVVFEQLKEIIGITKVSTTLASGSSLTSIRNITGNKVHITLHNFTSSNVANVSITAIGK